MAKKRATVGSPKPNSSNSLDRLNRPLTLIAQVEKTLRRAIEDDVFPGDRLPTTIELAEQLGVSRETVRLAMETLQHEGLLVKHRRRGTFVNAPSVPTHLMPTSTTIGYLQADYSTEQGADEAVTRATSSLMFNGALVAAGDAGYQMVVRNARIANLRHEFDELVGQARICGAIFASVAEEKLLRRLSGMNLPVVLLDHDLHLPKYSSIHPDSAGGAKQAVAHLAALGHRRIALAQWHAEDLNPWLINGYRQGMREAGMRCRRAWEIFVPITPDGGRTVVETICRTTPRPTAVICFSNSLANFVLDAARRRELRVPDELSVFGGGGAEVVGLSCIQLDWYDLGRQAMQMLLRTIKASSDVDPEHKVVEYQLHPGRTVTAM